jgi:hypothetical protein
MTFNLDMNILLIFMSFDKCLVMIDLTSLVRSKYDIALQMRGVYMTFNFHILIFMSFDKCLVMIDLTSLVRSKYDIGINEGGGDMDV